MSPRKKESEREASPTTPEVFRSADEVSQRFFPNAHARQKAVEACDCGCHQPRECIRCKHVHDAEMHGDAIIAQPPAPSAAPDSDFLIERADAAVRLFDRYMVSPLEYKGIVQLIQDLRASLAEARADSERLDWLEQRLNERNEVKAVTWTHDGRHEINDGVILVHRMKARGGVDETLRNTVDAFRRMSSGRETKGGGAA